MPSTQQLKARIRSVKSTKQITKAMQMVAASKMRRSQEATRTSRPYVASVNELLAFFATQGATAHNKLFERRKVVNRLIIVIASDKGLAGAFNTNIMKGYLNLLREDDAGKIRNKTIAVGRKASQFVTRLKDTDVVGTYEDLTDRPSGHEFHAILNTAKSMFECGEVDAVDVLYTHFKSSMSQVAVKARLLPAGRIDTSVEISEDVKDATFEPNMKEVLDAVLYRLVGSQLYQALLESRASEHSMRMMAMKNATDNASDLADDLTLAMNKARQGAITQELSEISAGVEAMK